MFPSHSRTGDPRSRLLTWLPLPIALAAVAYAVRGMFGEGYIEGSDTLAHLARIRQVSGWLRDGGLFDWTDLWYAGFHQFSLYPYLSYLPPGLLDALLDAPIFAMKTAVLGALLAGAAGAYATTLELLREDPPGVFKGIGAAAAAIIFALSPAFLGFMFGFGEYSDFVAVGFAPTVFLLFLRALRIRRPADWVLYGTGLALLQLLHPHVAVFSILGHLVYLVLSPGASLRPVIGMGCGGLLSLALSAHFWLPYLYLRDSAGDSALGTPFTSPLWAIRLGDYFDREPGFRYLGTVALLLAGASLLVRRRRPQTIPLAATGVAGAILALGGTIPLSSRLPVLDLVNPERALVLVVPAVALLAGVALASAGPELLRTVRGWQAGLILAGLIAFAAAESYFFLERTGRTVEFSADFLAINDDLAHQRAGPFDRVAFLQEDYNLSAYSPFISGVPAIDGSQVQGSSVAPDVALATHFPPTPDGLASAIAHYSRLNVRWLIVDEVTRAQHLELIRGSGLFDERARRGRYTLFERRWQPRLVRAVGPRAITIGAEDGAGILARVTSHLDVVPDLEPNALVELSREMLAGYGLVIIAAPEDPEAPVSRSVLDEYVAQGGTLLRGILEPGPGAREEIVEFTPRNRRVETELTWTAGTRAVLSMGFSPAWGVEVDGKPVPSRGERGLLSFPAAPGQHQVTVSYRTLPVQWPGRAGSLGAWIATLGWLTREAIRRRRARDAV